MSLMPEYKTEGTSLSKVTCDVIKKTIPPIMIPICIFNLVMNPGTLITILNALILIQFTVTTTLNYKRG